MSIFNEMTFLLQANAILLTNKLFQAPSSQIAVTAIVCVCVFVVAVHRRKFRFICHMAVFVYVHMY